MCMYSQVSCDVNVNNTIALRNTVLIKTYVEIDPRVKPIIMVVKHWAKQRVLNDAAKGGTLSSYCWVMMLINFLQTRSPPILPSLHAIYLQKLKSWTPSNPPLHQVIIDGVDCTFEEDLTHLQHYGAKNTETLGHLLYAFFLHYATTFDYTTDVVSVRHGAVLTKRRRGGIGH
ncbi:hypothetical protein BC829DRAFT_57749 [Chytridium lagenaria]|nr:hypothetical protein BC829DRAFT_57749 [Chytridium lagenaria]